MDIKKIINLFRKTEGYIGLNAEYANEIADVLEEYERRTENLIHYDAHLNNQLNKAEAHIESLQKQLSEKQPEWISVEDEPIPGEQRHIFTVLPKIIIKRNPVTGEPAYWMRLDEPKPKKPTFKDVFLEKFPKAATNKLGTPIPCLEDIFSNVESLVCKNSPTDCDVCWSLPYYEPKEEGEADA